MPYEISWQLPGKVLCLSLSGDYTMNNALEVNRIITDYLNVNTSRLSLVIDARKMNRPFNFDGIRRVQTYMSHEKLENIFVAADDRIVRLAMLVIFNLARAHLNVFESIDKANTKLQQQLTWFG